MLRIDVDLRDDDAIQAMQQYRTGAWLADVLGRSFDGIALRPKVGDRFVVVDSNGNSIGTGRFMK